MDEIEAKMIERLRAVLSIHGGHSLTNGEGHELWSTKAPVNVTALARHAIHEYERTADTSAKVDVEAHGWPKTPKDCNALITKPAMDWWWLEHKLATKRSVIRRLEEQVKALQATRSDTSAVELVMEVYSLRQEWNNLPAKLTSDYHIRSGNRINAMLRDWDAKAEQWLKKVGA